MTLGLPIPYIFGNELGRCSMFLGFISGVQQIRARYKLRKHIQDIYRIYPESARIFMSKINDIETCEMLR